MIKSIVSLVRPHQWAKNIFVLMPLFFSGRIMDTWCWKQEIITFIAFSLIASAIYCLNDLNDIAADRLHPKKSKRPLASGALKPWHAICIAITLAISGILICYIFMRENVIPVVLILIFYFVLNLAYCFKLKQYAIIDVLIVSFGFVLRLLAGGFACDIWLSPWIVLMTFLLALLLAFAKRRDDIVLYERKNILVRKNVVRYNAPFLNQTLGMTGAITIVCYILYTVSPEVIERFNNQYVYITSFFVLAAILRYLQVTIVDQNSGSPTRILLHDRFIQTCLCLWFCAFVIILYL